MIAFHLCGDELQYELDVRSISGPSVATNRQKTLALQKVLNNERNGTETMPKSFVGLDVDEETAICSDKLRDLNEILTKAKIEKDEGARAIGQSRWVHLWNRLMRIPDKAKGVDELMNSLSNLKLMLTWESQVSDVAGGISRPSIASSQGRGRGRGIVVGGMVNNFGDQPSLNFNESENRFGNHLDLGRFNHKSIPVHKWDIKFSGDGVGLSLNDFLAQVEIYRRAERMLNEDIYDAIHHLLKGKAHKWFMANALEFVGWDDVKEKLRRDFLPSNYHFLLQEEVNKRMQGENESFFSFITDMKILFQRVNPPFTEQFKLFVVRKNMLPYYSRNLATIEVRTVEELIQLCQRLEEARMMEQRRLSGPISKLSLMEPSYFMSQNMNNNYRNANQNQNRFRQNVALVSDTWDRNRNRGHMEKCWNCQRPGHFHKNCTSSRDRIFCFICGDIGYTVRTCPKNHQISNDVQRDEVPRNSGND